VAFFGAVLFIRQSRVSSGKSSRLARFFSQQYEKSVKFHGEKRNFAGRNGTNFRRKNKVSGECVQPYGEICATANFSGEFFGNSV
jgi:hypothetical protein